MCVAKERKRKKKRKKEKTERRWCQFDYDEDQPNYLKITLTLDYSKLQSDLLCTSKSVHPAIALPSFLSSITFSLWLLPSFPLQVTGSLLCFIRRPFLFSFLFFLSFLSFFYFILELESWWSPFEIIHSPAIFSLERNQWNDNQAPAVLFWIILNYSWWKKERKRESNWNWNFLFFSSFSSFSCLSFVQDLPGCRYSDSQGYVNLPFSFDFCFFLYFFF